MEVKILKCMHCGQIVLEVEGKPCPVKCCGEPMVELKANTTDGAYEKHVPFVEVDGHLVKVTVGSVLHPMTEPHHIAWIVLETTEGVQLKELDHLGEPVALFALNPNEKAVAAYEYCNLHGFWKAEI